MNHAPVSLPLGPVMGDVESLELTADDRRRLLHPLVGAVVLFARNYRDPAQLRDLTAAIRALRQPELLIAVDHEGGRVQRFREGFTAIPFMRRLGERYDRDREEALALADAVGRVIGTELAAHGVDFSFAPVLDLDWGESGVIGARAFHHNAGIVAALAGAVIAGLRAAGMSSCGKHFPGHGYVRADSHHEVPLDERALADIESADLLPFAQLARQLGSVMPAHVIYRQVAPDPAGFSHFWLQDVLRQLLGFEGVIFSDDLSMEGASVAGGVVERGMAALRAGCDMVLICNAPDKFETLTAGLATQGVVATVNGSAHLQRMRAARTGMALLDDDRYRAARTLLEGAALG